MRKLFSKFMHLLGDVFIPSSFKKGMKSCEQIGIELANNEVPKSFKERMDRWIHMIICYPCWTYAKQLDIINNKIKSKSHNHHECDHLCDKVAKEVINQYTKKNGEDS